MKPFFSIIVPCCNVGQYIHECLESIQNQSFERWECLCIIEDSTDNTETIVHEYADKDSRFKVFTQPRSGSVSKPRNCGMENAIGEYIIFCDGDDSITEASLARIAMKVSEHPGADIYPCAIWEYRDGGDYIRTIDNFMMEHPVELSGHDAALLLYKYWRNPSPMLQGNVWRRDFLKKNNLQCIPGLVYEDSEFFPRALYLAKRIVPIHEPIYLYRRHKASVTVMPHEPGFENKHWAMILKSLFAFYVKETKKPGFDKHIAKCWARLWIDLLYHYWFGQKAVKTVPRQKRRETLKLLFADGFGPLHLLAANTTLARRSLIFLVQLYLLCPLLALPIEQFFLKIAFPLTRIKNRNKQESNHEHGKQQV